MRIVSDGISSNSMRVIGRNGEDITSLLRIKQININLHPNRPITALIECYVGLDLKLDNYHLKKLGKGRIF